MSFWIFIGEVTGMPLAVQKCDQQPHICPGSGEWVEFVRKHQPIELTPPDSEGGIRE